MNTVNDCREFIHVRLANMRSLYRIVMSEQFEEIYSRLDSDSKRSVQIAVNNGDAYVLRNLLKRLRRIALDLMTMKDLRQLGQKYNVPNYNSINKDQLIISLREYLDEKSAAIADARNNVATPPKVGNP